MGYVPPPAMYGKTYKQYREEMRKHNRYLNAMAWLQGLAYVAAAILGLVLIYGHYLRLVAEAQQ